jgi:hypothetical protein
MTQLPFNRMATPDTRGRGRPPKTVPMAEPQPTRPNPAALQVLADASPPCCGRAQDTAPRVERWRTVTDGMKVADCICPMCGGRYVYTPAQSRRK